MNYLTGADLEPLCSRACVAQLERCTHCNKEPLCHTGCNKKRHSKKKFCFLIKKIKYILKILTIQ